MFIYSIELTKVEIYIRIKPEGDRKRWVKGESLVMYKRVLAGLLSLVIAFTSVSLPENVFAAQLTEQAAVEDTESRLPETEQVSETGSTEQVEAEDEEEVFETEINSVLETETTFEDIKETEQIEDAKKAEEKENVTEQQELSSDKEKEVDSALENEMSVSGTNSFGNLYYKAKVHQYI